MKAALSSQSQYIQCCICTFWMEATHTMGVCWLVGLAQRQFENAKSEGHTDFSGVDYDQYTGK